jgi:hypothetical protein
MQTLWSFNGGYRKKGEKREAMASRCIIKSRRLLDFG